MKSPPFLMWYDDGRGVTLADKVRDACAAYRDRFGVAPDVALVSADEFPAPGVEPPGFITCRAVNTLRRNTVWVGKEAARD